MLISIHDAKLLRTIGPVVSETTGLIKIDTNDRQQTTDDRRQTTDERQQTPDNSQMETADPLFRILKCHETSRRYKTSNASNGFDYNTFLPYSQEVKCSPDR